jgi:hypothetical protein
MFKWLKKILGIGPSVPAAIEAAIPAPEEKSKPKKTTTKKKSNKTCDFDKLTKAQLLKEAKHRGIKANASLSKAEILERVKNG